MPGERESALAKIIERLMGLLGVPIRGLLTTIGHSTVTAWTVVSIAAIAIGVYWADVKVEIEGPAFEALRRERDASARQIELAIAEKEQTSPKTQWRAFAINATASSIVLEIDRVPGATHLIASWKTSASDGGTTAEGIATGAIPDGNGPSARVEISGTDFAPGLWEQGRSFSIGIAEQIAGDLRSVYTGPKKAFTVP